MYLYAHVLKRVKARGRNSFLWQFIEKANSFVLNYEKNEKDSIHFGRISPFYLSETLSPYSKDNADNYFYTHIFKNVVELSRGGEDVEQCPKE